MKTTAENLERYYKDFVNKEDYWAFFLGLAYYVDYILDTPEIRKLADELAEQKNAEDRKIDLLGEKLLKEVKTAKEIVFKRIKEAGVSYSSLKYEMDDYEDFELRGAKSSEALPATLAEGLHDVIWNLSQNGHKELIKDFISEKNGIVYVDKHEFSKQFKEYLSKREKKNEKEQKELWGLWSYLYFAYVAVLKADEELAKVKKNKANWFVAFNLSGYFGEMKKISEGGRDDIIEFKPEKYRTFAGIINNYFIKELSRDERTEALQALSELENNEFYKKEKKKQEYKAVLDNFQTQIDTIESFKKEIKKQQVEEFIKNKDKITIYQLSPKNLIKVDKVLNVILDELELRGVNRLGDNKISIKVLEKEGVFYDEVVAVFNRFDCARVKNDELKAEKKGMLSRPWIKQDPNALLIIEKEFSEYLYLEVKDFNKLKEIKNEADKRIEQQVGIKEAIKNDVMAGLQKEVPNKSDKAILHLSKTGELWKEPKNKYCYPIEEDSDRLKIVRYFTGRNVYDFYPTQQIATDLEQTSEDLMRKIGKINNITKGKLKIKDNIFEGKKGSGYKINSKYKVVVDK